MNASFKYSSLLYVLIGMAVVLNFSGLFLPILEPDATRYAAIAKTMVIRHDYIDLFSDGGDWLDKPHFPFWITAFFFRFMGFTSFAYKLPGVLFCMMGVLYTYRFAKELYDKEVALWACLILLTAEHIILSNGDVRAEPYLTGLIIASVYHFYKTITKENGLHLIIACLFTGCAIMTKGIFALIPIAGAIAGELIIKKDWKKIFQVKWLVAALLVLIFILPELYCLYHQFDLHPEKIVFDRKNVSGIRFFFWDSQFGRFFNSGPIKGSGNPFFYFHTVLWAFLPWSVLLYAAVVQFFRTYWRKPRQAEWYTISASILTFALFSASEFQLPHYMNIVFPFFAIITAAYLQRVQTFQTIRAISITQISISSLLIVGSVVLYILSKPEHTIALFIFLVLIAATAFLLLRYAPSLKLKQKIIFGTALTSFYITLFLNVILFPFLLQYQSGSEAASWINKNNAQRLPVATAQQAFGFEFYLRQPLFTFEKIKTAAWGNTFLLYLPHDQLDSVTAKGWKIKPLHEFDNFPVSRLNLAFLNSSTRSRAIQKMDVVMVSR